MLFKFLLWTNISLFILHEMDAVHTREWRMIVFMKNFNDNTAHIIFTSLHFLLFIIIFYLLEYHQDFMIMIIPILLIIHYLIHLLFRKNPENRMNNVFSRTVILLMFINSLFTVILYNI